MSSSCLSAVRSAFWKARWCLLTLMCSSSPDCGLKTREWTQVLPSLDNMVKAAASMRAAKA